MWLVRAWRVLGRGGSAGALVRWGLVEAGEERRALEHLRLGFLLRSD